MKYKSQNKGITLVALVITVVVMLILAGVAMAQFTGGDGIFSRVTDATREYKKQSMLEAVDLAKAYLEMEKTYKNEPITITDVIDKVKEISSINDEDYIITIDDEEQSATIIDKETGVVIDIWIDENGEIQVEGSIVDDIENVVKPTITYTLDPPAGTYGEAVKITITATEEKNGIVRMVLPDNSEITYNNEKTVTREYTVTENGTYKFTVEGANGRETTKYVKVDNIMSASEIVMEVQNTNPTNQNVSIKITYDENVKSGGQVLINADRFQYSIGENNWQIATEAETTISVGVNGIVYARYYDGTTGFKTKSIEIENIDKEKPVISSATASTSWGETNSVTITATDTGTSGCATKNIGIVGYGINQSSTTEPNYSTVTATPSLNTTINNITANGTYYVWVKDQAGNTGNKQVTVNRIDTTAPTTATIASSNVEETTFTLTATGADGQSGIAKYKFYLNGVLEETIETTEGTATYNVTGKSGGESYKYKVRVYDKVGLYKESSEITVTTTIPVKIGDFVNYSVQVDSNGNDVIDEGETYDKWRILDLDNNGHMEIVCYNGPSYQLGTGTDSTDKTRYANAIKILNDESIPYGEGTYGYSTRHLGSDPSNPSSYETIDESYIKYYEDYDNIESNANYRYISQTHHESDLAAVQSFSNTADGKKLTGMSWLASRYVFANSSYSYFIVLSVYSSGTLNDRALYLVGSAGREYGYSTSYALAPVVILESGVKIDTSTAGNGSEGSPWTLTK